MNVSEHITHFEQEMTRRNFAKNTVDNYTGCLRVFFSKIEKDHPKNINESDIRNFLSAYSTVNTQRNYHSAIKRVYTHLLRHCSFTHMVENGTDINLIQKLAGHSNVKTTAIYTHISDSFISKIQSPLSAIKL